MTSGLIQVNVEAVAAVVEAVAKEQRMTELEKQLAYECARADIGSECFGRIVDGKQWFETNIRCDEKFAAFAQERVDLAVEYLELRGLLERHPSKPWVHVMELPA